MKTLKAKTKKAKPVKSFMRATVTDAEAVDYFSAQGIPYPLVIIKNPEKAALDGESVGFTLTLELLIRSR